MEAHFITGTGTDIGKTWLACALLRHWRRQGRHPAARKPVLSGFDPLQAQTSDAGALLAAMGRTASDAELDAIAPWRLAAPLSPDMAAALEGRELDFAALVEFSRQAVAAPQRPLLIEAVGGVMVPLDARHTVRDWIAAAGLPCILVAGSYLGSLSHTLTALEALEKAGIGVAALAVNETPGSSVGLDATQETLARHAPDVPLVTIARARAQQDVKRLAALLC